MKISRCSPRGASPGCGAEIIWAISTRGNKIPMDAKPNPIGRFILEDDGEGNEPRAIYVGDRQDLAAGALYTSHFATCPYAKDYRK